MSIQAMNVEQLLTLDPKSITRRLSGEEIVHIAKSLAAFWSYDYEAADNGRSGMHAILKSGRHSDGFFVSKILLSHENIAHLMAQQIIDVLMGHGACWADYVIGIPDGATILGAHMAEILRVKVLHMHKVEGKVVLVDPVVEGASVLFVEDVCTRGSAFTEAVIELHTKYPEALILPFYPVIINRGGLESINVANEVYRVVPIADFRINDFEPEECPLCARGSLAIKPKLSEANWEAITNSQKVR